MFISGAWFGWPHSSAVLLFSVLLLMFYINDLSGALVYDCPTLLSTVCSVMVLLGTSFAAGGIILV